MTDLTLEALRAELEPIRAQLAELRPIRAQLDSIEAELEPIRAKLDSLDAIRTEFQPLRAKLEGLPMLNRAITVLQQDVRALRAAFNDFARTNVTAGEIEALHADVNAVQARNAEIEVELATIKRLVEELRGRS